jgi:hypothetical protein
MKELISWDIYTVSPTKDPITGVMFRGRVRKYCINKECNVLIENAEDQKGSVRFAVPTGSESNHIVEYIKGLVPTVNIVLTEQDVYNPVLSKLKVNILDRYEE